LVFIVDIRRKNSKFLKEKSIPTDKNEYEPPVKKKRGRKPKSELKVNENEIEYEYLPIVNNQQLPSSFTQINIPPLSNFELKQIVEGLINHNQEQTLTFDEAQSFAINKAIDIGKI
jgi:hypothetical protein